MKEARSPTTTATYGSRIRSRTCATFFRDKNRFRRDFVRANELTSPRDGTTELSDPADVSVCLRSPANQHFVFYSENTKSVAMDLRNMDGRQPAVAVDARQAYKDIGLGDLAPGKHKWTAPYSSDWAIAIGRFLFP